MLETLSTRGTGLASKLAKETQKPPEMLLPEAARKMDTFLELKWMRDRFLKYNTISINILSLDT